MPCPKLFASILACWVGTSLSHRVHDVHDSLSGTKSVVEHVKGDSVALQNFGFRVYKTQFPNPQTDNDKADINKFIGRILGTIEEGRKKTAADVRPNNGDSWDLPQFNTYNDLVDYIKLNIKEKEQSVVWSTCKLTGPDGSGLAASFATQTCQTCMAAKFGPLFSQHMPDGFEAKPSLNERMCYCNVKKSGTEQVGEPAIMGIPTGNSVCSEQFCWKVYADIYNAKHDRRALRVDKADNWALDCPRCPGGEETCENSVKINNAVFKTPEQLKELKDKAGKGDEDAKDELDAIRSAGVVFTVDDDEDDKPPSDPKPSDRAEVTVINEEQDRRNEECKKRKIKTPCTEDELGQAIEDEIKKDKKKKLADECKRRGLPETCEADDLAELMAQCAEIGIPPDDCTYDEVNKKLVADITDERENELDVDDIIDAAVKEGTEVECTKYGLRKDCDLGDREMHRKIRTAYPAWPAEKPLCKDEGNLDDRLPDDCRKCLLMGRCRRHVSCMRKCPRTCDSKYGEKRGQSECHNAIERVKKKCQKKLNTEQKKGCFGGNNGQRHGDVKVLPGRETWMTVPDLCAGEENSDDEFFFEDPWADRKDYEKDLPHPLPDGMTICDFIR